MKGRINYAEKLSRDFTENTRKLSKGQASQKKIIDRYYDLISKAALAALESALIWEEKGTALDEIVATISISTARRILLGQDFPQEFLEIMKNDLEADKDRLLNALEKENDAQKKLL